MGDPFAMDRQQVRRLLDPNIKTFLDVGCGAAPEYIGLKQSRPDIEYRGVDITPRLVSYCTNKGIDVVFGTARNLPFDDASMDAVHARHVLEHMADFKEPLVEFIRVARQKVYVAFFIAPILASTSRITDISEMTVPCYNNAYSLSEIKELLHNNSKVEGHEWYSLGGHSKCLLVIDVKGDTERNDNAK